MTLNTQVMTMLSMIIGGVYLGFMTETFRRLSISWKNNVYFKYVFEIGFWVFQTCLLFYVLYNINYGELRIYVFLACLLGFSMYTVLFKAIYQRILEFVIKLIKITVKKTIETINVLLVQPIIWIIHTLYAIIISVLKLCRSALFLLTKVLLYPIKVVLNVIQLIIPKKVQKNITKMLSFYSTIIDKLKRRIKKMFFKRR